MTTRVSCKKLQRIAKERDEDQRVEFIANMAKYSPDELGFIDEVLRDERVVGRHYGRARKGQRARKTQPFVWGRRSSTVGVLTVDGFLCGMSVEGSLTRDVLLKWLEFSVVRDHSFSQETHSQQSSFPNAPLILVHAVFSFSTTRRSITAMRSSF